MGSSDLSHLKDIALECLIADQIRDGYASKDDYGSWGRTTIDYCFLSTMEPKWKPGRGSITQTAWALLAICDLDRSTRINNRGVERAIVDVMNEGYLFCQPIDVWLRIVAEKILHLTSIACKRGEPTKYELSTKDLKLARGLIQESLEAGVSPISVNQGIWFFSSNAVADKLRLEKLIDTRDPELFDRELRLMEGFIPIRPMWG